MIDTGFPFQICEFDRPDERVRALFDKQFHAPPPDFPRHFVAVLNQNSHAISGYVHFTAHEPGVFLLGGLCVDSLVYRQLTANDRAIVAAEGSLARWLMKNSIQRLGPLRAVFGYTGDTRSRRDTAALGFVPAAQPYLIVQWHQQPFATRAALVEAIVNLGPF